MIGRYFVELYNENGKLDLDVLTRFFEEVGIITEKTVSNSDYGLADCSGELGVLKEVSEVCINNYGEASDISLALQIASEINGTWSNFNHQYEPGITRSEC
jgi:hypothetical protein